MTLKLRITILLIKFLLISYIENISLKYITLKNGTKINISSQSIALDRNYKTYNTCFTVPTQQLSGHPISTPVFGKISPSAGPARAPAPRPHRNPT